jgi:hypothetical protein
MRAIGSGASRDPAPDVVAECTGTSRDPLTRPQSGARLARARVPEVSPGGGVVAVSTGLGHSPSRERR